MKLISVYVPDPIPHRLDKAAAGLSSLLQVPGLTRSDAIRVALARGLDAIDREVANQTQAVKGEAR